MYKMDKPTANMNISEGTVINMIKEQNQEAYADEQRKAELNRKQVLDEQNAYIKYCSDYIIEQTQYSSNRSEFLSRVKNSFMAECIFKLYKDCSVSPLTESDTIVARNLVNRFVSDNGAGNLINEFATKNLLLSEFSRITDKYYNIVVEKCNEVQPGAAKEFCIGNDVTDSFLKELEDVDTEEAAKTIKERVSDAISEFIDSNMIQKLEYEEVIKAAQDKIASATDENIAEGYSMVAKEKINEMKLNREKNIFQYLVESIIKQSLSDETLKQKYVNESSIDMDKVMDSAQLVYTMLEMTNTTEMVRVDEQYLTEYIKSFK